MPPLNITRPTQEGYVKFLPKNSIDEVERSPIYLVIILYFLVTLSHTQKLQNPGTTPSGRKVRDGERKKEKIVLLIVFTTFCLLALHSDQFVLKVECQKYFPSFCSNVQAVPKDLVITLLTARPLYCYIVLTLPGPLQHLKNTIQPSLVFIILMR